MKHEYLKRRIHEIIEASQAKDKASKAYDAMILVAVVIGLIPLTIKSENRYTILIDIVTAALFAFDYALRVYTADYIMGVKSYKAYLYYAFSPMSIVDLLSIIPILYVFFPQMGLIRYFRIFRIFRLLKLVRYSKTAVSIENVLRRVKGQLAAVALLTVIYILASAMILFQIEPDTFNTFWDAIYWSAVSITTIGYGDLSPVTTVGRMVTVVSSLVGVAVIALPSGIITAAYMDEIKKKKGQHEL